MIVPVGGETKDAPEEATWTVQRVLETLAATGSEENRAGMARYGIETSSAYGVSVAALRGLARRIGQDHSLAQDLWASGRHEARILAVLVDPPAAAEESQIDRWVRDLDSWDLCDQFCNNLVRKLPFARARALSWSEAEETFVKRAGFTLMASLAVHDKDMIDGDFEPFLQAIEGSAADERNYVKKAVNWALRQIGKRSAGLNARAVALAAELKTRDSRAARWIGSDACRELTGEKVQARLAASGRR